MRWCPARAASCQSILERNWSVLVSELSCSGAALGSYIGGICFDAESSYQSAVVACTAICFFAGIITFGVPEQSTLDQQAEPASPADVCWDKDPTATQASDDNISACASI